METNMIRTTALALGASLFVLPITNIASAREATINDAIQFVKGGDERWNAVMLGIARGIEGANLLSLQEHNKMLFCAPSNLAITLDQYLRILETYVDRNPSWGKLNVDLLGWIFVRAVADVFPCRE